MRRSGGESGRSPTKAAVIGSYTMTSESSKNLPPRKPKPPGHKSAVIAEEVTSGNGEGVSGASFLRTGPDPNEVRGQACEPRPTPTQIYSAAGLLKPSPATPKRMRPSLPPPDPINL